MDPTGGTACSPGTSLDCACSDGSMGMQVCAADGTSYDECECADADTGATGTSSPTTTSPTGSPTGDPSTESSSSESSGGGESSSTEESTSATECTPGETMECECGQGPGVAACMDDGQFGTCECCEGSHPLVEGELRYCEEGHCYCGDLMMKPPLDVCYAEVIADPCCAVDIECY